MISDLKDILFTLAIISMMCVVLLTSISMAVSVLEGHP